MGKLGNTLAMLKILETGRKYTVSELASKIEVSPRMIKTYKAELEKAGIYIDTIKGPYGGYVLNQNINVPKRFIIPNEINIDNKEAFNIINKAIKEKKKCYLEYYSKDRKEISKRTIIPYDLMLFGSEWGVAAYCEVKEEIRHFYINRIYKINIL